jgi:hypothetical protein
MLRTAYPPASHGIASTLVYAFLALVAGMALSAPLRNSASSPNSKLLSVAAALTLTLLVLGHLFGFLDIDGVHRPFFIAPAAG